MPLNASQRQILRLLVDIVVDDVIDEYSIDWLKRCVAPNQIRQKDFFILFDEEYLESVTECSGVAYEIRHAWRTFA